MTDYSTNLTRFFKKGKGKREKEKVIKLRHESTGNSFDYEKYQNNSDVIDKVEKISNHLKGREAVSDERHNAFLVDKVGQRVQVYR